MTTRAGLVVCLVVAGCGGGMPKPKDASVPADTAPAADTATAADTGTANDGAPDQAAGGDARDGMAADLVGPADRAGDVPAADAPADGAADVAPDAPTDTAPADAAPDVGPDGGDAAMCIPSGQECTTSCCADSLCAATFGAANKTCALVCTVAGECSTGCCSDREGALPMKVCSPAGLYCQSPPIGPPGNCGRFVVRVGSTFLGLATSNKFTADSVCNPNGNYGNTFSQTSIFNKNSQYGNTFGTNSAYNPNAFSPPELYCEGSMMRVAYVTKNLSLFGRVDPDKLCAQLAAWFIF
jgi:hypothetical protein